MRRWRPHILLCSSFFFFCCWLLSADKFAPHPAAGGRPIWPRQPTMPSRATVFQVHAHCLSRTSWCLCGRSTPSCDLWQLKKPRLILLMWGYQDGSGTVLLEFCNHFPDSAERGVDRQQRFKPPCHLQGVWHLQTWSPPILQDMQPGIRKCVNCRFWMPQPCHNVIVHGTSNHVPLSHCLNSAKNGNTVHMGIILGPGILTPGIPKEPSW